jgi:hypothetical protein
MGLLWISDPQYGGQDQEIWSFGLFLPPTGDFWRKTDRNSLFLSCDPHIVDRLYITVPYMSFYGF